MKHLAQNPSFRKDLKTQSVSLISMQNPHEFGEKKEREADIYTEKGLEELEEDDEIAPWEEGFMEGAKGGGQGAKCRKCGKILIDDFIERQIGDQIYRFCSEECSETYKKKKSD